MVYQPWMAHALGTFSAALFIWFWDRSRLQRGLKDALVLGLLGGLMVCVRWQNGLVLFLPLFDWLWGRWKRDRKVLVSGLILFAGFVVGISPQLVAWKALYDQFFLLERGGASFVRYSKPFFWETLFSSRHELLTWTPVLWLGYLGLIPLLKRRLVTVWMMTFCVVAITYLNMSVTEWWSSNSFSNRRFDGALPILAFGVAASFEHMRAVVDRWPAIATAAMLAVLPLWTLLFMEQYHRHHIPIDNTVSFTEVASNSVEILFAKVGYPFAWPVNWWFAWAHDTTPDEYDTVFGRYFFFLRRVPSQVMEIGDDDGGLIGEGWNRPELRAGRWVRTTRRNKARLYVPLERNKMLRVILELSVRPRPVEIVVTVNGNEKGRFLAEPGYAEYQLSAPVQFRQGANILTIEPKFEERGQILLLDRITFELAEP